MRTEWRGMANLPHEHRCPKCGEEWVCRERACLLVWLQVCPECLGMGAGSTVVKAGWLLSRRRKAARLGNRSDRIDRRHRKDPAGPLTRYLDPAAYGFKPPLPAKEMHDAAS